MTDSILASSIKTLGIFTRLKTGNKPGADAVKPPQSTIEKQMADMISLSGSAQDMIQKNRKVDSYLQIFKSALQMINGSPRVSTPQIYKADIEYFQPKQNFTFKKDV